MKITSGFLQFCPEFKNPSANLNTVLTQLSSVNNALIVLPELALSGYNFQAPEEIRPFSHKIPDSPEVREIEKLAVKNSLYLVTGISEEEDGKLFNSSFLCGPEGYIGKYRKVHLFYREKDIFQPGDLGFPVFKRDIFIGMMICFDWFFPESCRSLALSGALVIAHSANLVLPYCPEAMLYRSLENRVFSITANRTGSEENNGETQKFIGSSQVVSPKAERLIYAGREEAVLKTVEIDLNSASDKNLNRYNNLFSDRKIDQYSL